MSNGMIQITVKKRWRRAKNTLLFASLAVPPVLMLTMLDVWVKHPVAAVVVLGASAVWDILFAIANKKPRRAGRSMETVHPNEQDFRVYSIMGADLLSNERRSA